MSKDEKKRGEESIAQKYHDELRKKVYDDKYINEVISICGNLDKDKDELVQGFKQDLATPNKDEKATTIPHNTACIVKNLKRTCKTILGSDVTITTKEIEKNVEFWTDIYFCFRKGLSKFNRSLFDEMQFEGYSVDGRIKPIIDKLNEHLERNFGPEEISSITDFNSRIKYLKIFLKTLHGLSLHKDSLYNPKDGVYNIIKNLSINYFPEKRQIALIPQDDLPKFYRTKTVNLFHKFFDEATIMMDRNELSPDKIKSICTEFQNCVKTPKEILNIFLEQINKKISEIIKNSKTNHIKIDREHLFIYLKNIADIKTEEQKFKIATKLSESIGTKFDLKKTGSTINEFFKISNKLQENIGNNNQDFEHIYKSVKSFLEHDNNLQILVNKIQDSLKTQLQNSIDNHQINSINTKNLKDNFLAFIELLSQSNYCYLLKAESTKSDIIYLLYSYTAFILAYGEESCGYEDKNPYKSEIRPASKKRKRNFKHIAEDLAKDKTTQLPTDIMRLFYNILCIYTIFKNIREEKFTEITDIKNYFNIEQNINDATTNLLLHHNLLDDITFKLKNRDIECTLDVINNMISDCFWECLRLNHKDDSFDVYLAPRSDKEMDDYLNSNEYKNKSFIEKENHKYFNNKAEEQHLPIRSSLILPYDPNWNDKFAERNVPQLNFTLENIYCFVFVDRIDVKIKNIESSFVYVFYGINTEGNKEILDIKAFSHDEPKLTEIFNSIKKRGVNDILFLCVNEVSSDLENSLHSIFPRTVVLCSIPHLIINSTEFIPKKLKKDFCADCEKVYRAGNLETTKTAFESLKVKWAKDYPKAVKIWENNFEYIRQLNNCPAEIHNVICTTVNALKSLNSNLLKITTKKTFENTKAVDNTLYRKHHRELSRIWSKTKIPYWEKVLTQLSCLDETVTE